MTTPNTPATTDDLATDVELMPTNTANALDDQAFASLEKYARSMDVADRIAEGIYRTDYAGPFKGKKADMAIAILSAAGLGIRPENVGKAIYVVHGSPALYGKTALAIAKSHGYKMRKTEESPQAVTCVFTAPDGEEYPVTYTYERAEREGLVKGNAAQYKARPEKMLTWKCVGEAADMFFPHILNNLPVKEDIEQGAPVKATATRTDRRGGARAALSAAAQQTAQPQPQDTVVDDVLSSILAEIQDAPDRPTITEIMARDEVKSLDGADHDQVSSAANERWQTLA